MSKVTIEDRKRVYREERAKIDALANALYDKLNPRAHERINVSKAECIKRVEKRLLKRST